VRNGSYVREPLQGNLLARRLDLPLRTPDALNIAIAQRVGADLVTFDDRMVASARALGITLLAG
jgi:predicted nucleic acid-binding protein